MGGHEFAYFAIIVEHRDAWELRLREAAEGNALREGILVGHFVVRENVDLLGLEGIYVQHSISDVIAVADPSLVLIQALHEERLPLLEVPWLFDPRILEDDVAMLHQLL